MDLVYSNNTNDSILLDANGTDWLPFNPKWEYFSYLDFDTLFVVDIVVNRGMKNAVLIFGAVTNVINVIVFYRQGIMSHSCTVGLTGLAVSDFFICLIELWSSTWTYIHNSILKDEWNYYAPLTDISYERPLKIFSLSTLWLTSFVAFERCFSVIFPFKVNIVFTPRRSCFIIFGVFICAFIFYIPFIFREFVFPGEAIDVYILVLKTYDFVDALMRLSAITIVVLCNVALAVKVGSSLKFKKSKATTVTRTVTSSFQHQNSSNPGKEKQAKLKQENVSYNASKETKLVRMIMVMCTVFTMCYSMNFVNGLNGILLRFGTLFIIKAFLNWKFLTAVSFIQSTNSSYNFIVYYTMSTRYRQVLHDMFLCRKKR